MNSDDEEDEEYEDSDKSEEFVDLEAMDDATRMAYL